MIGYLRYVAWALWHGHKLLDYRSWQEEENLSRYLLETAELNSRYLQEQEDTDPGWLCWCGHWQEDDLHCEHCGGEPPWGCDCEWCHDKRCHDDEDWEDDVLEWGEDPYDEYDVERDHDYDDND